MTLCFGGTSRNSVKQLISNGLILKSSKRVVGPWSVERLKMYSAMWRHGPLRRVAVLITVVEVAVITFVLHNCPVLLLKSLY